MDVEYIKSYLHHNMFGELNDSNTRSFLEKDLGVKCDESLNPPEVIRSHAIRFEHEGTVYEYGPSGKVVDASR